MEQIIFLYLQANGLAHRNQNIYIVHDTNSSYLGIHYNNRRDFSKFDRSMMTESMTTLDVRPGYQQIFTNKFGMRVLEEASIRV
jgi:hypothetical protein